MHHGAEHFVEIQSSGLRGENECIFTSKLHSGFVYIYFVSYAKNEDNILNVGLLNRLTLLYR